MRKLLKVVIHLLLTLLLPMPLELLSALPPPLLPIPRAAAGWQSPKCSGCALSASGTNAAYNAAYAAMDSTSDSKSCRAARATTAVTPRLPCKSASRGPAVATHSDAVSA